MDRRTGLAGLLLWALTTSAMASSEDEVWIERFMSEPGRGAQPAAIRSGYRIAWGDLRRFIDIPVKVATDSGSQLRGRIERADEREILLRAQLHGGYADLVLRRDQVISTELE
jgi:hypothetical protein